MLMSGPTEASAHQVAMPDARAAAGAEELLVDARAVIGDDARAVAAIADTLGLDFVDAVRLLVECRGKVLVAGLGISGTTARRIAHVLSLAGTPALFVHAADGLHGGLGAVSDGDVVIAISRGGDTGELNEFVRRARLQGAQALGIVHSRDVPLAGLVDIALEATLPEGVDPGGMINTGSSLAAAALGDALAMAAMRARGYPWSSFEFTHPGGAVGKLIEQRGQGRS